jgi:hypothetical protein
MENYKIVILGNIVHETWTDEHGVIILHLSYTN